MSALTRPATSFKTLLAAGASAAVLSACSTTGGMQVALPTLDMPRIQNGTVYIPPPIRIPPSYAVGQHVIERNAQVNNGWEAAGSFTVAQAAPNDRSGMPNIYVDARRGDSILVSRTMTQSEAGLLRECGRAGPRAAFHDQCALVGLPREVVAHGVSGQRVQIPVACPPNYIQYRPTQSMVPGMASTEVHVTAACAVDRDAAYNVRSPYFKGIKIY